MKKNMGIPMKRIKSNSSLSRRFSLSTIMAVTSILLVMCIVTIAFSIKNSEAYMKTRLDNTIRMANASIAFSLWNVQDDVVKAQTDVLFKEKGIAFIEIRDEDGSTIAKRPGTGDFSFLDEKNLVDKKKFYLYKKSDIIYIYERDKRNVNVKVGSIRVAIDKNIYKRELFTTIIMIIGVTIAIIIAITLTSIVITKRHIFRPLSKLETSAGLIAEGNLDTLIDTGSEDEIGKLAKSFDGMRLSVKKLVEDLQNANQRLDESNKNLEQKVEERTKELKKAIDVAEKNNQALNLFIANMSHEIRTPMHNILGFIELLEKRVTGGQEKNYISVIKSNSNLLLQLLNGILDLSKIRVGKLELITEPVDFRAILAEVKRSFLIKLEEKKLVFNINVDTAFPPSIYLDGARLRQVLLNLVGNAVKFTDSGYVSLEVKLCSTREEKSVIDFAVIVEDTGRGIDQKRIDEIFKPFVQEDGAISFNYGGAGLGLSISKALVELMNGTIRVESELGKGSRFRIDFKNIETKPKEMVSTEKQPLADVESIVFEKKTILVVEDNKDIRGSLRLYLEDYEFEIIEAEDGSQGIEYAKKHHPDLIIMDMKMPGMSGFEAVKKIKEDSGLAQIPVIAFTAHALKEEEEKIMALGCSGFLRKPVSRTQLIMELAKYLPHTIKETPGSIRTVNVSPADEFLSIQDRFPAIPLENIDHLIETLEKKFQGKWQDIQKSLIIKNAKDFAVQIKELGTAANAEILINWADRLLTAIQLVQIDQIAAWIALFPKLVEQIKSKTQSKNGEKHE
jgi:signal transduction histidine kinase/DNA-binding LytR/AlgR family response regulator